MNGDPAQNGEIGGGAEWFYEIVCKTEGIASVAMVQTNAGMESGGADGAGA